MWRGISLVILIALIIKFMFQITTAQAQSSDSVFTPPTTVPQKLTCTAIPGDVYTPSPTWKKLDDCGVEGWKACPSAIDAVTGQTEIQLVQGIHSSTDAWGNVTCYAYCYSLSSVCDWAPVTP
jgi:hypothetical protein